LQILALANQVESVVPGFPRPIYPDWECFILSLNSALKSRTILYLDEFPYLVNNSPELPSVWQKIIDEKYNSNYHLILCGSSQQMMYSMVLDSNSPLYGRCDETIRVKPMGINDMQTSRWWGTGTDKRTMEIDLVAESLDKSTFPQKGGIFASTCSILQRSRTRSRHS
jgi:AAA+ ATPase superfamily predicted ATPase